MEAGARGYDLADDHPGSQDIRIFQDSGPGRSNSHSKASRFVAVASWFQISDLHAGRKLGQEIHEGIHGTAQHDSPCQVGKTTFTAQ